LLRITYSLLISHFDAALGKRFKDESVKNVTKAMTKILFILESANLYLN